jgi:hypothetical protein
MGGSTQPPTRQPLQNCGAGSPAQNPDATWKPAAKHISGKTSAQTAFGGVPNWQHEISTRMRHSSVVQKI